MTLQMVWVKGHGDDPQTYDAYSLTPVDVIGNIIADKLADHAASLYKVWECDVFNVNWHLALVQKVQARAICIFDKVLQGRTNAAVATVAIPKERPLPRPAAAFRSQHRFTTISGRILTCRACLKSSPTSAAGVREWLASPCVPDIQLERATRFACSRPTDVPAGRVITIGRSQLHHSHRLSVYRGLYFCTLCGYTASVKAQQLTKACTRMSSQTAIDRVLALRHGKLPSGRDKWPNEAKLHERRL